MRLLETGGAVGSEADASVYETLFLPVGLSVGGEVDEIGFDKVCASVVDWVRLKVVYVFDSGEVVREIDGVLAGSDERYDFYYLRGDAEIHGIVAVERARRELKGRFLRASVYTGVDGGGVLNRCVSFDK